VEKANDPEVFFRPSLYLPSALVIDDKVICTGKPISVARIQGEIRKHNSGG
jgi:hypothetical protein